MELDNFLNVKRNYPEDVPPAHVKEKIRRDVYAADKGDDSKDIDEEDEENEEYDDETRDADDVGDVDTGDNSRDEEEEEEEAENQKQHWKRSISHGYHLVEGKMEHGMEDFLVAKSKKLNGFELGLYAIFDGHAGREVAEYLQAHLFESILNEPNFWTNPKSAIKRAYRITDNDILENVVGSRGGSTAVTAILIDGRKLIVANVGDSRAVLCIRGKAKQLTVDHEPEKEKDLVESKGGFISQKPGNVPRVDGQLAMTRAFGDAKLKDHITVVPDVVIEKIDEDVEFLILASDGLWKVMSNQEAIDCIRGIRNGREAAKELIREALERGSKDDISCVVVMFN